MHTGRGNPLCSRLSVASVQGPLQIAHRHCQRHALEEREERRHLTAQGIRHVDRTNVTRQPSTLTLSVLQPAVSQATASGWLSLFAHQAAWS